MKQFLTKYFGIFGLVIYCVLTVLIRIPVAVFLSIMMIGLLILWNPIARRDNNIKWLNRLYDWYNAQ